MVAKHVIEIGVANLQSWISKNHFWPKKKKLSAEITRDGQVSIIPTVNQ